MGHIRAREGQILSMAGILEIQEQINHRTLSEIL